MAFLCLSSIHMCIGYSRDGGDDAQIVHMAHEQNNSICSTQTGSFLAPPPPRDLLAAPVADARELQQDRLPVPRIIESDQGKSQGRFLLAKVNPSSTYSSDGLAGYNASAAGEVIFTDDVSLEVFMEHLKKLSVAS